MNEIEKRLEVLEKENVALKEKIRRLSLLMESIRALNTSLRPEVILKNIIESATQILDAESGSIMLKEKGSDNMVVVAATGKIEKLEGKWQVKKGEGISGKVAETGKSILVTDIENDPRFKQKNNDERYKTKSFLCVPIKVKRKVIGVLNISDKRSREVFNEDHLKILVALLSQTSFVLEYIRLYEEIRQRTQDWEPF